MNEALALSKLATKLLRELEDISDSVEDDSAVHSQSIETILSCFESVEYLVSQRKKESDEPDNTGSPSFDDESVN